MIFGTFEFDDSVSQEVKDALQTKESVAFNPTNLFVGDQVRLYPRSSDSGYLFKCVARRFEMTPDEEGDAQLVFVLASI